MKRLLMKGLAICLCVMLVVLSIPIQIAGAETSLEGWFDEDAITVYLGDITPVSGYVTCNGSDLVQITYQIEGWSGEDDNNRYCTQTTSGKSVDLWDMDQLLLDTTTEPLNVPGNYVLWLVARAEDGYWDKLDSAIVCVEENEDEYDNEWDDDWEDEYDNEWEYDEVETDYEENHSSDRVKPQDTTNVATELWGMFYDDSVDLTIGDAVRVNGYVSSEGSEIVQVTYQIDGWYGIDENNRYCTQETNSYDLNLADMNSLVLNTNTEPLNMPGTYTLRLAAKTADGTWKKLDSMTVYVRDVFSSNASASEEHAASREPDANSNNSDNVSSLPSAISSSSAVKTVEAANIRAEANKDSESLGTVPADTVLDYYGYSQKDNRGVAWYLVNYQGKRAWISSSVADVIAKSAGTDDVKANTDNQSSNTNSEVIIEGGFGSKSYGMMTGSKLDVYFGATVQNANLHSATINIDGYQNAQYVNKQFSDVGHACSDYLTLDGSVAPLNTPGTYTIKLFIKSDACDANGNLIYKEVDRATLVVQENATNKTEQTTTDSNKTETSANTGGQELSVEFTYDTKTIVLGETWPLQARIRANNVQVGEVRIRVLNTEMVSVCEVSGDEEIQKEIHSKSFLTYDIDTTEYPFNQVGEYTLQIYVKDADDKGGYDCLDEMTIKVVAKEPYFTTDNTAENATIRNMSASMSNYAYSLGVCNDKLIEYGFEGIVAYDYKSGEHTVACCIAKKMIWNENGQYVPLYAVIIRGSSGTNEWFSNFDIGTTGRPYGFDQAAKHTATRLRDYIAITSNGEDISKAKLWITGHSRGAAVANLIAGDYAVNELGFSSKNIYAYTFATPYTIENTERNQCNWVRNYAIDGDVVTYVPMANFGFSRFGITKTYTLTSEKAKTRGMNTGATTSKIVEQFEDILGSRERYVLAYNEIKKIITMEGEADLSGQAVLETNLLGGPVVLDSYISKALNKVVGLGALVDHIDPVKFKEFCNYIGETHSMETYLEFCNM